MSFPLFPISILKKRYKIIIPILILETFDVVLLFILHFVLLFVLMVHKWKIEPESDIFDRYSASAVRGASSKSHTPVR